MTATKKPAGKGKGKKSGSEFDMVVGYLIMILVGYAGAVYVVRAVVAAATAWWADSLLPWWETWHTTVVAGAFTAIGLVLLVGVLWVRSRWVRRIEARATKRQPEVRGGEKPTVKVAEVDAATKTATKAIVTWPDGVHPSQLDERRVADVHGHDLWGAPAVVARHVNDKTGRTQLVLTPPAPDPAQAPIERDLTKIAQEQLPHVQAVTVTARDKATGLPTRVEVHHEVTAKLLASPAVAEAIERALAAHLGWDDPNTYRMHWDRTHNVGVLEQCDDPLPRVVPFPFGKITDIVDRDSKRLYYGVTATGKHVYWDLDRAPHALVAGKTGAGKTVALTVFVTMALLMGWRVVMLDPKKLAFRDLDGLPNFERYGDAKGLDSARQIAEAIDVLNDLMDARYDLPRRELKNQQRILFVIDETYIGIEVLNDLWAEEKEQGDRTTEHPAAGKLRRMSGLAREANIHMLMAIQRADTSLMGKTGAGYMRSNLDTKITLGPMDSDGAPMMFGRGTEWARMAQEVPAVKGRALTPLPEGVIGYQPAQVWWIDIDDDKVRGQIEALVAKLHGPPSAPLVDVSATEPAVEAGAPVDVEMDKPAPAKRARRPTKKASARRPADDAGPTIASRDSPPAVQIVKGDWTLVEIDGTRQAKRVETREHDEDTDRVTLKGFGWDVTYDASDPCPRLHIE
jgi:hypothetical protein